MATTIKVQLHLDGIYVGVADLDELLTPVRYLSFSTNTLGTNDSMNIYEVSINHNIYGNWGMSLLLGNEVDRNITNARGIIPHITDSLKVATGISEGTLKSAHNLTSVGTKILKNSGGS